MPAPVRRTPRKKPADPSVDIELDPRIGKHSPSVPMAPPPVDIDLEPVIGKNPAKTQRLRAPVKKA